MLRGTKQGLELRFAGRPFREGLAELEDRLSERSDFYRGAEATAVFDEQAPAAEEIDELRAALQRHEVKLRALGGGEPMRGLADGCGLEYVPREVTLLPIQRRPKSDPALSSAARSLAADFEGARVDLAARRLRSERNPAAIQAVAVAPVAEPVAGPSTLFHTGTLRGGQSLHQLGNIVLIGDCNPGAELVASGDILVFGALRGTAHAGAQGDAGAKVYALELLPTQLRIAQFIAAPAGNEPKGRRGVPEMAVVRDGNIAIQAYAK